MKPHQAILLFGAGFLFFSGVLENYFGLFPECIGVCNIPETKSILAQLPLLIICFCLLAFATKKNFFSTKFHSDFWVERRAQFLVFITGLIVTVLFGWNTDLDDKWLVYRVSMNVLRSGLPVWNLEDKINLSTSLIWPYVATIAHFFKSYDLGIKVIGIAIYCISIILLILFLKTPSYSRYFAVVGVATYFPVSYWTLGGLETSICVLWITFVILTFHRRGIHSLLPWFVMSLGIFFRPELILVPISSAVAYVLLFSTSKLRSLLIGLVITTQVGVWLFYNKFFFGDFFPTPAYIKSVLNNIFMMGESRSFVIYNSSIHFLSSIFISIFLCVAYCLAIKIFIKSFKKKPSADGIDALVLVLLIGFLSVGLYHIVGGYNHMGFVFRYFIPVNYAVVIIISLGLTSPKNIPSSLLSVGGLISITLAQLLIFIFSAGYVQNVELSLTRAKHRDAFAGAAYSSMMKEWRGVGISLASIREPGDRLWMKDGANLAGGALSGMYSLDGFYAPLRKSAYPEIRNCNSWGCARYFDYIILQSHDASIWMENVREPDAYKVELRTPSLLVLKNTRVER